MTNKTEKQSQKKRRSLPKSTTFTARNAGMYCDVFPPPRISKSKTWMPTEKVTPFKIRDIKLIDIATTKWMTTQIHNICCKKCKKVVERISTSQDIQIQEIDVDSKDNTI